jgi:putative transposase
LDPRFARKAADVLETLERTGEQVGYPRTIRIDNGPEFVAKDLYLGRFNTTSPSSSAVPASPQTTPSRSLSTARCGQSV